MAIALVDHKTNKGWATFSLPAMDSTGATVIVVGFSSDGGTNGVNKPTLSDSNGNTYVEIVGENARSPHSYLAYSSAATGTFVVGASHVVTGTCSGSMYATIDAAAFSGVAAVGTLDQHTGRDGGASAASPQQPGSITPAAAGALVVASLAYGSLGSLAIDSGFTILDQTNEVDGVNWGNALAYLVQGSAAAINPSWTFTSTPAMELTIASFKAAAGAAFLAANPLVASQAVKRASYF